jgi:PAS domain S-box-containing protein
MARLFNRRLLVVCGVVVAALALNAGVTFRLISELRRDAREVAETDDLLAAFEKVISLAKDAETGQRGYLITQDPSYLEPYDRAVVALGEQFKRLERLTAARPQTRQQLDEIKRRLDARLETLAQNIKLADSEGFEAAQTSIQTGRGKREMDALRRAVDDVIAQESAALAYQLKHAETNYQSALLTSAVSNLFGLAMLGALIVVLRRHLHERAVAADALRDERERFRTTLASIGDAVITTDVAGRVTYLNAVAESLTGWTNAEAQGQPLANVFDIVNEHSRQHVESPVERVLRENVVVGLANHTVLISKDGVERPIDDSAAPIRDHEGRTFGVVLVFRDVTARREADRQLRETERQFRTLADTIPQLAWMADPDGSVFWYNRRWYDYTGTTLEQMQGWGWQSVHDPDELPRVLEKFRAALAAGEHWEDTFPLRRSDGVMRWHLSRMMPLRDDEGRVVRWFGTNTDVTHERETADKLRSLAAELSEADRRKDEFLATLAHELRNPLAPISNALSILKTSGGDQQAFQDTRDILDRQVRHMVRLIDDLLDLSRISRNRIELRKEPVELADAIAAAVESCRPAVDEARHELSIELPAQQATLVADPVRLAQVFANLLQNACKYTPPGGRLSIVARVDGDRASVAVRDDGVGIPSDMLGRIFDMFTQVEPSLDRAQGGLGIGLTLVKRLVEMHGGAVEARSEGPGRGSEFVVHLPLAVDEPSAPAPSPAPAATPSPKARILVVDDNRDSATSLVMLLKLSGHDARAAFDGLEAVQAARQWQPQVILLDLGLPKLNGYEAARQIRQQPGGEQVVVVALTGWGQDDDRRKSAEYGFDRHFVKPVEHAELMRFLNSLDGRI